MEVNEREIIRLVNEIRNIRLFKLGEWYQKTKKYLPIYVADYLFRKKTGIVDEMISEEIPDGLMYDPMILRQGIDMLMVVMENQNNSCDLTRGKSVYLNFADPEIRVGYLKPIIDQLDIFPSISKEFIADLESVKQVTQDPETVEIFDNYIRNVKARTKMQEEDLKLKQVRQRQ